MTPAVARFLRRIRAKAATMQPDMARAYLAGLTALRDQMSTRAFESLVATTPLDMIAGLAFSDANLNAAFSKYRAQVQLVTRETVSWYGKDIPGVAAFVRGGGGGIAFDHLAPNVLTAMQKLDTQVMARLATTTREGVRAVLEQGLKDGLGPRQMSIAIRDMIGLGAGEWQQVANFRAALEGGPRATIYKDVLNYTARDKRFDATLLRLRKDGGQLATSQIDRMVTAYTQRRVAISAATTARTATLDSFRAGQRLSWEQAAEAGIVDRGRLMKEWMGVDDGRERETHLAMNGTTIPFDEPYILPDGLVQMEPGEGEYNCRCSSRVFVGREG